MATDERANLESKDEVLQKYQIEKFRIWKVVLYFLQLKRKIIVFFQRFDELVKILEFLKKLHKFN